MIDVILVCYNSEKWLDRCVESLSRQGDSLGTVHLVDNACIDAAKLSDLQQRFSFVQYHRCCENQNYGGGNNIGIRLSLDSNADAVMIANPDTWFEPDAISALEAAASRSPEYGILAPVQLEYESNEHSLWVQKTISMDESQLIVEVPWLEGSCMLIRRELLDSIGGFDPLYQMYYEDNDYCRRATSAGFKCGVVTAAQYHHYSNASFATATNPARVSRIDLSQFVFQMTDPNRGWLANHVRAFTWLGKRSMKWMLGRKPGFGHAIWKILGAYFRESSAWKKNWSRRKSGDFCSELPTTDQIEPLLVRT